jgi:hypothetical protein
VPAVSVVTASPAFAATSGSPVLTITSYTLTAVAGTGRWTGAVTIRADGGTSDGPVRVDVILNRGGNNASGTPSRLNAAPALHSTSSPWVGEAAQNSGDISPTFRYSFTWPDGLERSSTITLQFELRFVPSDQPQNQGQGRAASPVSTTASTSAGDATGTSAGTTTT